MGQKTPKQLFSPLLKHLNTFLTPSQSFQCIQSFQIKRPTTFRFNLQKITKKEIPDLLLDISKSIQILTSESKPLVRSSWHSSAYKIDINTQKLMKLPQYLNGSIIFQNQSSMIPPLALFPINSIRILDMCASPGNLTTICM